MDPIACLARLRELCADWRKTTDASRLDVGDELAEHFEALDDWMSHGGFSPWKTERK